MFQSLPHLLYLLIYISGKRLQAAPVAIIINNGYCFYLGLKQMSWDAHWRKLDEQRKRSPWMAKYQRGKKALRHRQTRPTAGSKAATTDAHGLGLLMQLQEERHARLFSHFHHQELIVYLRFASLRAVRAFLHRLCASPNCNCSQWKRCFHFLFCPGPEKAPVVMLERRLTTCFIWIHWIKKWNIGSPNQNAKTWTRVWDDWSKNWYVLFYLLHFCSRSDHWEMFYFINT